MSYIYDKELASMCSDLLHILYFTNEDDFNVVHYIDYTSFFYFLAVFQLCDLVRRFTGFRIYNNQQCTFSVFNYVTY